MGVQQKYVSNVVTKNKNNILNSRKTPNVQNIVSKKKDVQKNKKSSAFQINGKKYPIDLKKLNNLEKSLLKLNGLIGLHKVKDSIVDMILYFLQNFEKGNDNMLHTVIEGPPGVGKTELGTILADIYAGLGITKNNKFKVARRSDLIGEYLGQTAVKTQKIIDEADGGVLFIDEAYALGHSDKRDSYSKECIDTLNQNLTENKKNFICIIAGYADELDACFFVNNPGLKRRFPFKFTIEGYKPDELKDIFKKKINDCKWKIKVSDTELTSFFKKNKDKFPYYGGDMENFLVECKMCHSRRIVGKHPKLRRILEDDDLKKGFDRYNTNKKPKEERGIPFGLYV